ncbi:MAG: triphosphoribosyl-dephospho-CoA synthase CitG [Oscillospiraceae bacterium]
MNTYKERVTCIKNSQQLEILRSKEYEVSLCEMLDAREIRVNRQVKLMEGGDSLVCFTMNIAGPYKNSPLIKMAFDEGVFRIKQMFEWSDICVKQIECYIEKTGCEGYFLSDSDPYKIKKALIQIEDSFTLGRLYDIDVIKPDGVKISRTDIGEAPRNCLICGGEGAACARSRAHTVEQLQEHTVNIMCDFFNKKAAQNIGEKAVKSLLYEVSVTPKPGLVDRKDSGAHRDMDFFTFVNSSCSLYNYFEECATTGILLCDETPQRVFQRIRYLGRLAEEKMYNSTQNVNTHKGAIFSLGIICAAVGFLEANKKELTTDSILDVSSQMAKVAIDDFKSVVEPHTFGEKLYSVSYILGIRGQAAEGYPAVKNIAYPILMQQIKAGVGFNGAGTRALIHLIAEVEDTNIIKRSSEEELKRVQKSARELLQLKGDEFDRGLDLLNEELIQKNISPGGCADLLSVSFMLYFSIED